jgi:hypothetical protein
MAADSVEAAAGPPVTLTPLPDIQNPLLPLPVAVMAIATAYAAPAAGVAVLGVADTEPPAAWQPVQADA